MKIRNFVGIALLLILSLIYTWYEANRPQSVDWSETYSPKDKIPYGTYITYRSLPELFPASKIRTSRLSIAEEFGSGRDTSAGTYIFVGLDYRIDALELKHLMQWVEKGNDMFVAAGWIADTLLNALSLKLEQNLNPSGSFIKSGTVAILSCRLILKANVWGVGSITIPLILYAYPMGGDRYS